MRTRALLTRVFSGLALIGVCATAAAEVTESDLQHHRWVLESINGNPALTGDAPVPELDFGEQMTVSGNTG